jgi:ribose/xylose/arabinose/galactoside ABC-type transport system permease subunit
MTTAGNVGATSTARRELAMPPRWTWLLRRREILVTAVIVIVVAASTAAHPYFWASGNLAFIFADSVVIAFLALGESFVMIGRGIDLSVGAIMGLSAIFVGFRIQNDGISLLPAVLLGAAVGIVLGLGNAVLVGVIRLPPIIATLGTLSVYSGLEFVITNGNQVDTIPNSITNLGSNTVLPGIPVIALLTLPFVLIAAWVLRYTTFGRSIYAVGDDAEAAYRAGLPVQRILFSTYLISGLFAGLGGVAYLIYTSGASSTTGINDNLTAIAAAIIGGTALTGGVGGAFGALAGSVFLTVTLTAMSFAHVSDVWQPAGVGVLVLLAVVYDSRSRTGGGRRGAGRRRGARAQRQRRQRAAQAREQAPTAPRPQREARPQREEGAR